MQHGQVRPFNASLACSLGTSAPFTSSWPRRPRTKLHRTLTLPPFLSFCQCPYFFASCPLVTVNNLPSPATPSDDPSRPSSSPLTPDFQPGNLASPWNSPHVKPSTQTCLVIPMPLNQYKAQMFKNQQDQLEGTKADVGEMRASTTSAFPTSSYIRPSLVINPSDTTMTSISSPSLPFSPEDGSQPWFSAELDSTFQHPSPTPSSSSNPFAFFTDPLDTPATYDTFYDAPLEFASSAFGQVEQQLPIAYDEPTSVTNQYHPPSSFSSFPYSPDPFAQYIGSFESFGDPEMAQAGASSSRESSPRERDASVLVVTSPPPSIERRTSESHLNDEMLGEQTAFISKARSSPPLLPF